MSERAAALIVSASSIACGAYLLGGVTALGVVLVSEGALVLGTVYIDWMTS